jgi:DNA-binding MarR family transcriptional regulator
MKDITRILAAMDLLRRRVHKEMPSQHIVLFLTVADNPGVTMPELSRLLDMPQGTVSRNVKILSQYVDHDNNSFMQKGRNLLRTQPDNSDGYCLAVHLTGRGELLINDLISTLYPENDEDSISDKAYRRRFEELASYRLTH